MWHSVQCIVVYVSHDELLGMLRTSRHSSASAEAAQVGAGGMSALPVLSCTGEARWDSRGASIWEANVLLPKLVRVTRSACAAL